MSEAKAIAVCVAWAISLCAMLGVVWAIIDRAFD